MKNYLRQGFTLIELLIVIVIIGVLATAVLSAINPIEQIRKAEDAGRRSDSAELLNAIERYYTSFRHYPWEHPTLTYNDEPQPPGGGNTGMQLSAGTDWLQPELVGTSELKGEFTNRDNLADLFMFLDTAGGTDLVRICFEPQSNSYLSQAGWTNQAVTDDACVSAGCYECVPE